MKIQFTILILLFTSYSWAATGAGEGFLFHPQIYYNQSSSNLSGSSASSTTTTTTNTYLGLGFAYMTSSGFMLGGQYRLDKTAISSNSFEINRTAYGPQVGYAGQNIYLTYAYYMTANESRGTTQFKGSGSQFDFGWRFDVSGNFSLGPQITYMNFTYDKVNTGSADTTLSPTYSTTELQPHLALWFHF